MKDKIFFLKFVNAFNKDNKKIEGMMLNKGIK